ncbi:MAG: helix-turn-helix transcriptional regulator [Bacilli bacterium]|nr:helix-turn-helix transcriptional regulator [Bacilli bacterium]
MEKLKQLRTESKLTHQMMADMLKVSKPFYWQLEHDQKRLSYDMAIKISKIFGLKPDDIFYDELMNDI